VIVVTEIGAVGGLQAVDHAGLEVGNVELPVPAVVSDIAERGPAVGSAVERDLGEDLGLVLVSRVELVDRAGPARLPSHAWDPVQECAAAPGSPHAGHPARVVGIAVQAERGGGGQIDIRGRGVVERYAEHLAHLACGDRQTLRLVDPMRALRRLAGGAQIDDAADRAGRVDNGAPVPDRGPGKAGYERFARLWSLLSVAARAPNTGQCRHHQADGKTPAHKPTRHETSLV